MKVTTERLPESQMLLNIEVEEAELESHKERSYRRLVQRATVPGFRKGKAPRPIFEQFFGPQSLLQEALDTLVPETTAKAIEEQGLEAVAQPTVEIQGLDPVTFTATVPLKPTLDLGEYLSIRVPWEEPTVTDEQVDGVLEQLRQESTPWEPTDRPVEMGDMVTLRVHGKVTGPPPKETDADLQEEETPETEEETPNQPEESVFLDEEDWTYHPRPESTFPAPGFADQIVGMQKGEAKEFTLTPPEDHSFTELAGRECHFSVTLIEVKEQRLPEMDDEWAKGVRDGYASLAELRQSVLDDLTRRTEQQARQDYENKALERLLSGATLEYPPVLVEHEVEHLLDGQKQRLGSMGINLDHYLTMMKKSQEEMVEEMRPEAQRRVVNTLVLHELAQAESLEVTEEEVEEEVQRVLREETSEDRRDQAQRLFSSPEARASLHRALLSRKTMDNLVEIARREMAAETQEESPGEESAETSADAEVEERS